MLFENVLSAVPSAIFWKDVHGIFQGCNQHFLDLVGLPDKATLLGKNDKELPWHDRWQEYQQDDAEVMKTGGSLTRIEKIDTPVKCITSRTTKVPWTENGQVLGVLCVLDDITALVEVNEKLELSNKIKSDFVENMQHDLRTPAYGLCDTLLSMIDDETNAVRKVHLTRAYKSSRQILNLCTEITDFDRITNHGLEVPSSHFDVSIHEKHILKISTR